MLSTWNGPLSEKMRTLFDYFDMPASLVFGRMIDYIDDHEEHGKYDLWPDILAAIRSMYDREHFALQKGHYFVEMKTNTSRYVHPASEALKKWLTDLRTNGISTFLITGSFIDFANCTATAALGSNWKEYFDFIAVYAKKPGFFSSARPFCQLNGEVEGIALDSDTLKLHETYSQGNWRDMIPLLVKRTKDTHPKFLYFGDNLLQDIYTPSKYTKCDCVGVVEELLAEGMKGYDELHIDRELLSSKKWGSFFANEDIPTLWAHIIRNYSKICIPSVETMAKYSVDHEFFSFSENEQHEGYYPSTPLLINKF